MNRAMLACVLPVFPSSCDLDLCRHVTPREEAARLSVRPGSPGKSILPLPPSGEPLSSPIGPPMRPSRPDGDSIFPLSVLVRLLSVDRAMLSKLHQTPG